MKILVLTQGALEEDPVFTDLGRTGMQLEAAASYGELLARLSANRYDAVLIDEGIGGDEALRFLAVRPRAPVLVLGTGLSEEDSEALLKGGASDVLFGGDLEPTALRRRLRFARARHWSALEDGGVEAGGPGAPAAVPVAPAEITLPPVDRDEHVRRFHLLQTLFKVVSRKEVSVDQQIEEILLYGCELFGEEIGIVSRIEGDRYTVEHVHAPGGSITPGQQFDLAGTFCAITLQAEGPLGIADVKKSRWGKHPCTQTGLESYIGVPITVGGLPYGTLNFSSVKPQDSEFPQLDLEFVETLGEWVSTVLTRSHLLGEVELLSTHDSLTGLPNLEAFLENMERRLGRARRERGSSLALLLLDLDDFRAINDAHGFISGDKIIQQVADRLRAQVRPGDLLGRHGGDEFVILLDDMDVAGAEAAARRMLKCFDEGFNLSDGEVSVHASVGAAVGTGEENCQDLFRAATAAIFDAKREKGSVSTLEPASQRSR